MTIAQRITVEAREKQLSEKSIVDFSSPKSSKKLIST